MSPRRHGAAAISLLAVLWTSSSIRGEEPLAPPAGQGTVLLDTVGFWRMHHTMKGSIAETDDGLTTLSPAGPGRPRGETAAWDATMRRSRESSRPGSP